MSTICVTGIWHQGTVLTGCLAESGHTVKGVCEAKTFESLRRGIPPVREPSLPEILQRNLQTGRLNYTTSFLDGVRGAEFIFISTDTPVDLNDDSDLSVVYDLAERIAPHIARDGVLCVTAQVPVGTSTALAEIVRGKSGCYRGSVAYVPEFLRLGGAVDSFYNADRFVIGCDESAVAKRVGALFEPLNRPLVYTDIRSAEMAKHASNAFLAASVSFINEVADLSERLGADAVEVARIMKLDRRIGGHAFLGPGLGFAGGTLGREVRALQKIGSTHGVGTPLMDAIWDVNVRRGQLPAERLASLLGGLTGRRVGILGLTYKPGTSTMRQAVSIRIVRALIAQGASIVAYDPLADLTEVSDLPAMRIGSNPHEVAEGCDALVLVTEWGDIGAVDWRRVRSAMKGDLFLDTRNLLDPTQMAEAGFAYYGVGRAVKREMTSEVSA